MAHVLIIYPAEYTIITGSHFGRITHQVLRSVGTRFIDNRVCLTMNNFAFGKKGWAKEGKWVAVTVNLQALRGVAQIFIAWEKSYPNRHAVKTRESTICGTESYITRDHSYATSERTGVTINKFHDSLGGLIKCIRASCLIADWHCTRPILGGVAGRR